MSLHIPFSQQKRSTWQGGQVHEIFCDPPEASHPNGDYRLWAGTATIERAADYSYFAHAERLHIPLAGHGLRLTFDEPAEVVPLATYEFCTFSGTRPLHAAPMDGPVFAFNLIYRQGQSSGGCFVDAGDMPAALPIRVDGNARLTQIVYAVAGEAVVEWAGTTHLLRVGDTFVFQWSGPTTATLRVTTSSPETRVLLAHVQAPDVQPTTSA